ncbi:MAG: hypothetical protein ABFD23_06085 [Caldisericales bacterium]|nr:hypothetical protein [bacterium]
MFCGISRVETGNQDITDLVASIKITDVCGEPSSCTIETVLLQADQVPQLQPFCQIGVFGESGEVVFGGRCDGVPKKEETPLGTRLVFEARDWSAECKHRMVNEHYMEWMASDIYKSLVAKYLPGHTTDLVRDCDDTVSVKFNGQSVEQCFKTLCDFTGWVFRVSPQKIHYFGPAFLEHLQVTIRDPHCDMSKGQTTPFEPDYSTLANRVWVEGGEGDAENFTKQYILSSELPDTPDPNICTLYPFAFPIWYKCSSLSVYAVFDSGDGLLEKGSLVLLDCDTDGLSVKNSVVKTNEPLDTKPALSSLILHDEADTNLPGTFSSDHKITVSFDALYCPDATAGAQGGWVYLSRSVKEAKGLLGFMVKYRRKLKISYVSEADEESVGKYGVQIDMPKVTKPAIKDWAILYKYADYLLSSHKDPPRKGKATVYRYKGGQMVYPVPIRAGVVADFEFDRFGVCEGARISRVTHEITPMQWRMVCESSLDPNLYASLLADVIKRLAQLEQEASEGDIINAASGLSSGAGVMDFAPSIKSFLPKNDYGFGESLFGACEWEGQ